MLKKIFKEQDQEAKVRIVKLTEDIKYLIFNFISTEKGRGYDVRKNYLQLFEEILAMTDVAGKLTFKNLKDSQFDVISEEKTYKIKLLLSGFDNISQIIICNENVTKTYYYYSYETDKMKLDLVSVYTLVREYALYANYCKDYTSYKFSNPKAEAEIYLYDYESIIIAPKRNIIERKLLSFEYQISIKDILTLIYSVYGKQTVQMSKKISVQIKELNAQIDSDEKQSTLVDEVEFVNGNVVKIFKKYGNEAISINYLKGNFIFSNGNNKVTFHASNLKAELLGEDSTIKDYGRRQIDSVISQYTKMLCNISDKN